MLVGYKILLNIFLQEKCVKIWTDLGWFKMVESRRKKLHENEIKYEGEEFVSE